MSSYYQAYQAYERRVQRGEFSTPSRAKLKSEPAQLQPLLARLGDWLILAGFKLKKRYTTGTSMALSSSTWRKP
jgi:hypothetical protein